MIEHKTRIQRPLSPHLQIYRLTITMVMSIVWWLFAAGNARDFDRINGWIGTWFGQLILFGFTWTLLHHMLGGIRHLIWDTTRGLEPGEREMLAWATLIGSVTLTVIVWIVALMMRS